MADRVVFLTLHEITADALRDCIEDLLADCSGPTPPSRVVRMVGEDISGPADLEKVEAGAAIVTSTDLDAWAALAEASGQGLSAVYVRSELAPIRGAMGRLWPEARPESQAWSQLLALDLRLSLLPRLRAEDVHGRSRNLWPDLAATLGLCVPQDKVAHAGGAPKRGYSRVLAGLAPPMRLGAELDRAEPWMRKGPIPVCAGATGLRYLNGGWAPPESELVWSHGPQAGLRLPCRNGEAACWRLEGWLIGHPERKLRVTFWSEEVPVGAIENATRDMIEFTIDLWLAPTPSGVCTLVLQIDKPVVPRDLGGGSDGRALGVALRCIERRHANGFAQPDARHDPVDYDPVDGRLAVASALPDYEGAASKGRPEDDRTAFLDDALVVEVLRSQPGLALVLASDAALGEAVARMCRERGCRAAKVLDGASGLAGLAAELGAASRRVSMAILCDETQHQPWFDIVGQAPAMFGGAGVVLPTGDPYKCPGDLFRYSQTWNATVQFSEGATVSSSLSRP